MTIDPPELEAHLALQRVVDLGLHAVLLEVRIRLGVELHARREVRHDALDELEHTPVFGLAVDANRLEFVGQEVAQQFPDEALLLVHDCRRPARIHLLPDLEPRLMERVEVGDDVFFAAARGGGADDDAASEAVLFAELADDAAQA